MTYTRKRPSVAFRRAETDDAQKVYNFLLMRATDACFSLEMSHPDAAVAQFETLQSITRFIFHESHDQLWGEAQSQANEILQNERVNR